jgi:malate dehydrogenase
MPRIAVTGAAGQIAYNLLFSLANGAVFKDEPLSLFLCDLPAFEQQLNALAMELEDCAFPNLKEVEFGSDPFKLFERVDYAILLGAKPRTAGMERGDLLKENGKIFVKQGQALNEVASKQVKVLVVGNPCNTNCLIAQHHAPSLPKKNFHAMMRLDQNRAIALLAKKAKCSVSDVSRLVVWGNHSATQVPDFTNARIRNRAASEVIREKSWLQVEFTETIRQRGTMIIHARGKSSAASAAHSVIESLRSLIHPTPEGDFFTSGVNSDENPYGIEKDLIFGFPCRSFGNGEYEIVSGLPLDYFIREKIAVTQEELITERECVREWL